jgi:hypothetical protein
MSDELEWGEPTPESAISVNTPRLLKPEPTPEARRRGRLNRSRGNAFEREVAAKLGIARRGQYGGKDDVAGDWIVAQCKVGGAFPERIWRWLPPANGEQLRAVVIGDAPGSAGKRRTLICLDLDDFADWYGRKP